MHKMIPCKKVGFNYPVYFGLVGSKVFVMLLLPWLKENHMPCGNRLFFITKIKKLFFIPVCRQPMRISLRK